MIIYAFYSFIASLSFAVIYNVKGKNVIIAGIGGGISWLVYLLLTSIYHSNILALFMGTISVSIYSEIMARIRKAPVTTFIICGIIPLVPGNGMYYTMYETIIGNLTKATSYGIQTLGAAGAIATALAMVSSLSRLIFFKKKFKSQ